MTDQEALDRARAIWGPKVAIAHDVTLGYLQRDSYYALVWDKRDRCDVVASSHTIEREPASWEAMFSNYEVEKALEQEAV